MSVGTRFSAVCAAFVLSFFVVTSFAQEGKDQERVKVKSLIGEAQVQSGKGPNWRPMRPI